LGIAGIRQGNDMSDKSNVFREISAEVGFSGDPLDRLSDKRDDVAFVEILKVDHAARTLVIARDMPVMTALGDALDPWFDMAGAAALGAAREMVLLGRRETGPVFATLLDDGASRVEEMPAEAGFMDRRVVVIPGRPDLHISDLRSLTLRGVFDRPTTAMLAGAKSLLYWHARHRFCSVCGAPSTLAAAGWRRECTACKATHFPRTDPVVIMLAIDGDNCLLGRQPRFPKGMYSALAGFLEPGETIEEAVRREIKEEAGIDCGRVDFVASQPWPFPSSLMIGCFAHAITRGVVVDRTELDDARWFTRSEAKSMLASTHPNALTAPQPLAIAHHLLRAWAHETMA
jgi:NAD+ diphosphatase